MIVPGEAKWTVQTHIGEQSADVEYPEEYGARVYEQMNADCVCAHLNQVRQLYEPTSLDSHEARATVPVLAGI